MASLTLVIMLACLAARRVNGAVLTAVSVVVSVVATEFVLKPIFGRTLGGALVYPSGHAGRAFTLAAVIVVLLLNPAGRQLPTGAESRRRDRDRAGRLSGRDRDDRPELPLLH